MPYPVAATRGGMGHLNIPSVIDTGDFNAATWVVANAKAFWRFQGDGADKTGRGNTLTEVNAPTYAAGKVGNAVSLVAASSQYLSRASTSDLQIGAGDWVCALWVKFNAVDSDQFIFVKSGECILFMLGGALTFGMGDGAGNVASATSPSAGTWYLVICWYDRANGLFNLRVNNGVTDTVPQEDTVGSGSSSDMYVGSSAGVSNFFDGQIDDTFIFKPATPLSSDDFNNLCVYLWNGGSGQDLSVLF